MAFDDVVVLTHFDDGFAALSTELVHMNIDIAVVTFGTEHNDAVIMANLHIVARQLTAEVGRTLP